MIRGMLSEMAPLSIESGSACSPISKSSHLAGLQCQKLLWHRFNAKDQFPPIDAATQAIFDQGQEVGRLAQRLFPSGIAVSPADQSIDEVVQRSARELIKRVPLYEAGFVYDGAYARIDILNPIGGDEWDLIEVKSTTGKKDAHLPDIAFQAYVAAGAGLKIRRSILAHINPKFVRNGEIDPLKFFILEDVTQSAMAATRDLGDHLARMTKTASLPNCPDTQIGSHCDTPYGCPLHDLCWAFLPEGNVTNLYRGKAKGFQLLQAGVQALADIPYQFPLTANQEIQRETAKSGEPHIDKPAIAKYLEQIVYPVSYLDFETIATAIPLFDGVKPFQQVPFQFSLHIQRSRGEALEHHGFLAEGVADPRPEFMHRLRNLLPVEGSVVVYNAQFEVGRLRECCDLLPEYRPWESAVEKRMIDLLVPFRGFRYYHPAQNGSASMKEVLPALTGHGYDRMDIQEGGQASREFLRSTYGNVSGAEQAKVRKQLEEYCGLDTRGMFLIIEALQKLVPD